MKYIKIIVRPYLIICLIWFQSQYYIIVKIYIEFIISAQNLNDEPKYKQQNK